MTPAKPTPGAELVEPLRQFLESFTQELTEQQFIPAFREQLGKLSEGLDNIQQSGESLQQIARGVDRLKEVFAPAGTRMLEGVKEIETQMRQGSEQMRVRAEEVLLQLAATQRELEQALRAEAGIVGEQSSASREALQRLSSDIEERLQAFSSRLDGLCRKAEQEIQQISQLSARVSDQPAYVATAPAVEAPAAPIVYAPNTDEIGQLLARTESTVTEELARYSAELRELLSNNTRDQSERIAKLDKTIDEALRLVAPKVQAELDSALARLRDQMDAMVRVERERPRIQSEEQPVVGVPVAFDSGEFTAALSGTENRLLREFDDIRKSNVNDLSEIQKGLANFALDLSEMTEKQTDRIEREQQNVKELLVRLDRMSKERTQALQAVGRHVNEQKQQIDGIRTGTLSASAQIVQQLNGLQDYLHNQAQAVSQSVNGLSDNEEQRHSQLRQLITRLEDQSGKVTEQLNAEARTTRERIDSGLAELRSRWDGRFELITQKTDELSARMAAEFAAHLGTLKQDVEHQLASITETLRSDLARYDAFIREQSKQQEAQSRELSADVSRTASLIDDKLSSFQSRSEENERFTRAIETHVKVVASEVSALRSRNQESLEILKESIRANYDDNAARLKEVIDGGYDRFLEQIRTVPQAIERYSKFLETMNQSNQLALQGLAGDAQNLVTMTSEMKTEFEAQKKFYPLLNKSLDKHEQMLDAMRRSQSEYERGLAAHGKTLGETRDELTRFLIDLRGELRRVEGAEQTKLSELSQMLDTTIAELEKLQRNDLPAFRRDVLQLVQSKFEFIESTQAERQIASRAELSLKLDQQQELNRKSFKLLATLVGAGVLLQIVLNTNLLSLLKF